MSWLLRKRTPSEPMATGAIVRVQYGNDFGSQGSPLMGVAQVDPRNPLYQFHEGDLFDPGTGNFVFESTFENPIQTIWGFAFLRKPNTFSPIQRGQIWAPPTVVNNGVGGPQAGQIELQPLINPENQSAPFAGDFAFPIG